MTNQPGRFGLERLINSAQRKKLDDGIFELAWTSGAHTVSIDLRIISSPQVSAAPNAAAGAAASGSPTKQSLLGLKLPATVAGGA